MASGVLALIGSATPINPNCLPSARDKHRRLAFRFQLARFFIQRASGNIQFRQQARDFPKLLRARPLCPSRLFRFATEIR